MHGIGQPHAVRGRAEAHLLLHTLTVPPTPASRETTREEATGTDMASAYHVQIYTLLSYQGSGGSS